MAKPTKINFCSFCGKPQGEVKKMIAGPASVFICDSCVRVCKTIIDRELGETESGVKESGEKPIFNHFKPAAIKAHLDEHVFGQDHAKKFCLFLYIIITKGLLVKWVSRQVLHQQISFLRKILMVWKSRKVMCY